MEVEDELRQWYLSPPSPLEVTRPSSSSSSPGDEPSPLGRLAPQRQRAGGIIIGGAENNIMDDPPQEIITFRENHHLPSSDSSEDEGIVPGAYADRTHSRGQPFSLNVQPGHREDEYEHEDEHRRQSSSSANQENHARLGNDSSIRGLDGSTRSNARRRKSASSAQRHKKERSNSSRQRDFDGSDAERNSPNNNLSRSMNTVSLHSSDNSSMALSTRKSTKEKHILNASARSKPSSHSSGTKIKKKSKHPREGSPHQNSVTSTSSNVKNGMTSKSTYETSFKPISSTTSKSEGGAPSMGGMSPEKPISRRDVTSDGENIKRIVVTGSNKPKERRPSRPQPIRESEEPQKKYESPVVPTVEKASLSAKTRGGLSSSIRSKIQRCLKPFKSGKRRQNNQAKDDMVKTNPYALDESEPASDFSHTLVSTVEKHDICMAANSRAYSEAHERGIPNPQPLIMASDGSTKKGDLISSMNSSSHHLHQSLHSISEHDVLHEARVRPKLGNHSSHSDGDILRGRDALRFSTHSEGGARGMANTTNFGLSHSHHGLTSPTNKRHGSSNLDSSFTDVSMTGTIMTSYSTTFKAPVALNGLYSQNLASLAPDDDSTHITNAPWSEDPGAGDDIGTSDHTNKIQGKYFGPVNSDSLQPDGEGALVIMDHTFYGTWEGGKLISHLTAEPEAKGGSDSNGGRRGSMETSADDLPQNSRHSSIHSLDKSQTSIAHSNISSLPVDEISNKGVDIKYVINKIGKPESIADEVTSMGHPRSYGMGDACRTPNDMIIHRSDKKAIQSTALLKKWDQAFIKRSNGVWTVAFMIDRALQPKHISRRRRDCARWCTVWEIDPHSMELEESMLFVINDDGATKIINNKCWGKYVRRMKT